MKYLIKRIFNMNYRNFSKTINEVAKKASRLKISIFFDMIYCGMKYQCGYIDYSLFEFYNMPSKYRKTIITRGVNNKYVKKLNKKEYFHIFSNKDEFNAMFSEYLNRDWKILGDLESFRKFINNKSEIIVKPISASCGVKVEKINLKKVANISQMYQNLLDNKQRLIEEVAIQNHKMATLHPSSVNTCRVVTINVNNNSQVVVAFLRIGNNNEVVDNFNHGGICAKIDVESGIIRWPGIDKKGNIYNNHPLTKKEILNFKIPMWKETKELCLNASKKVPEIGYTAWDVCIGEENPFLIEGNEFPGYDLYELPIQKDDFTGLKPMFDNIIENNNKK